MFLQHNKKSKRNAVVNFDMCLYKILVKPELERTHKNHQSPLLWCLQKQLCKLIVFGTIVRNKICSSSVCLMHKKHIFGG